ncbi:hypothetical protein MalM25_29690 [Planctomycetes bacterium MalM25]|nr:hypothetical protein MalM25_29690 [Planctomycetes bacterium MalM25]
MAGWRRRNALIALFVLSGSASALQIDTRYYAPGELIPSLGEARSRPESAVGEGDLQAIVRAAADTWESLIGDDHTLVLHYGWYPTTGFSNSAFHVAGAFGGVPLRQFTGSLAFNSDEAFFPMYLDPTPESSEEFLLSRRDYVDLGAGQVESARWYTATTPEASRRNDVYTAALHEIGHALGLTESSAFLNETFDADIDILSGPFAGSSIPVVSTHLEQNGPLLSYRARNVGERRGITQVDLLAVCQISSFEDCRYELTSPEAAADLNNDGVVDAADYTVWRDAAASGDPNGDVNSDGQINDADFGQWRDYYGVGTGDEASAGSLGVPEPASLVGLGILLAIGHSAPRRPWH